MPALRRSIVGVTQVFSAALTKMVSALVDEERLFLLSQLDAAPCTSQFLLDRLDVTADYTPGGSGVTVKVEFMRRVIWSTYLPMSRDQVESKDLDEKITSTMKSHLNLVAQMHHARLDQMFPNSIAEVVVGYEPCRHERTISVKFRNGHAAEGYVKDAKTEEFHARCAMLYDLPPI